MATQSYGLSGSGTPESGATGYGAPEPGEQKSTDPDQIRREIEATRAELANDVDRLADKASPKRVAQRNLDRLGSRVSSIKESVMGAPKSAGGSVRDSAQQAGSKVQETAAAGVRQGAAEGRRGRGLRAQRRVHGG